MKVFLIFLLEVMVTESWQYTKTNVNGYSYYTNYTSDNIKNISFLSEKCLTHGYTQLLEIHNEKTALVIDEFLNKYYNSYSVPLNLMRVEETKWAWSNEVIGSSSFDQKEIQQISGQQPWYAYLQCVRRRCIYKPGHPYERKYSICQNEGSCIGRKANQYEYEDAKKKIICYSIIKEKKYWTEARQYCLATSGLLATFKDVKVNRLIKLTGSDGSWWVGLQKARWMWNGSKKEAMYTRWDDKQPQPIYIGAGNHKKKCVISVRGKWKAISCDGYYGLVCMKRNLQNTPSLLPQSSSQSTFHFYHTGNDKLLHVTTTQSQTVPIKCVFYRITLPIIIFVIVFIIVAFILFFYFFRKRSLNNKITKSQNANIISKTNTKKVQNENDPTYTQTETDGNQYLKVINVDTVDTIGIHVQKIYLPQNKEFQKNRRNELKSVLFDENVVFERDVPVLYNIIAEEKNLESDKNMKTNEIREEDEDHFYDKLSFSNSRKEYLQPNKSSQSHPELQPVNGILADDKIQSEKNNKDNISGNQNEKIVDNDELYMNSENHPQSNGNSLEIANKEENDEIFYLRTSLKY